MKSLDERLDLEIEAVENDDSLTDEQKKRAIKELIREAREIAREEWDREK